MADGYWRDPHHSLKDSSTFLEVRTPGWPDRCVGHVVPWAGKLQAGRLPNDFSGGFSGDFFAPLCALRASMVNLAGGAPRRKPPPNDFRTPRPHHPISPAPAPPRKPFGI